MKRYRLRKTVSPKPFLEKTPDQKYYMMVHDNLIDVYRNENDKETKLICRTDAAHTDLCKMLPILLDNKQSLENLMIDYFNYAEEPKERYSAEIANTKLSSIISFLSAMHPFFRDPQNRLTYIGDNLTRIYKRKITSRFRLFTDFTNTTDVDMTAFLHKSLDELNKIPICKKFQNNEQIFLTILNAPLKSARQNCISGFDAIDYIKYQSTPLSVFKQSLWMDTFYSEQACNMEYWDLLSTEINEYVFVAEYIIEKFPQLSTAQIYALFLTQKSKAHKLLHSDTVVFHSQTSMITHICKYAGRSHLETSYLGHDNNEYFQRTTNYLYNTVNELINENVVETEDSKISLSNVDKFYPKYIEKYLDYQMIEFTDFEQFISFEFINLIKQNQVIKKCHCHGCSNYFLSHKKNVRYCPEHRSNAKTYRSTYLKQTAPLKTDIQKIYEQYSNCFSQRVSRAKSFGYTNIKNRLDAWKNECQELIQEMSDEQKHVSPEHFDDFIQDYIKRLNAISLKHQFSLPRHRSKK